MKSYTMEWDKEDLHGAILMGFDYIERKDEIVGCIYVSPRILKDIVLSLPDEFDFDYIPEGVGMIRTAYVKFKPSVRENEIRFENQEKSIQVRLILS